MSTRVKPDGVENVGYYHSYKYHSVDFLHRVGKMHGFRRVLYFCVLTTIIPTTLIIVSLYLRHTVYADVVFAVTESDIVEITDGISPIFCSEHSLRMNESFNAFQVSRRPEKTSYRKHIRLKKSMTLPDDTLEYWGFYLLKGATVALSVCSRFEGASILVVKGERNLRTCGMLDHNRNKARNEGIFLPDAEHQVKVTFESNAQEIDSKELVKAMISKESHQNERLNRTAAELARIKKMKRIRVNDTVQNNNSTNNTTTNKSRIEEPLEEISNSTDKVRHFKQRMKRTYSTKNKNSNNDNKYERYPKHDFLHMKRKDARENEELTPSQKHHLQILAMKLEADESNDSREIQDEEKMEKVRNKRNQFEPVKPELLDRGIRHGGNAAKDLSSTNEDSSISSFENGLLNCYGGSVLLAHEFDPSEECLNVSYLVNGKRMQTTHEVGQDGYYYYIFYSDNDIVSNDMHAVFDIYKPTLQYENVTKACINQTECSFLLSMTSSDRVIVEVPTRDGIDHEIDDISLLTSVCHPRMGVYMIFPITVLILVMGCAFV